MSQINVFVFIFISSIISVFCVPKYDTGSFVPSSIDYMEKSSKAHDQLAMPSQSQNRRDTSASTIKHVSINSNDSSDRNQEPRFGFTNVGGTGSGYGVSTYGPGKIDLGGLLLGAVIGVGTILIIPKLLYILSGSYGAYARSDDGGYAQMLTKLDDALARHGIDTTSCMQRMVCSYTQQASEAVRSADSTTNGEDNISSIDKMIDNFASNQVLHTALQGTAIQEAMESGRSGQNCARVYHHCVFSMETMLSLLSNVIASANVSNTRQTIPTAPASTNAL